MKTKTQRNILQSHRCFKVNTNLGCYNFHSLCAIGASKSNYGFSPFHLGTKLSWPKQLTQTHLHPYWLPQHFGDTFPPPILSQRLAYAEDFWVNMQKISQLRNNLTAMSFFFRFAFSLFPQKTIHLKYTEMQPSMGHKTEQQRLGSVKINL